MTEGPWDGSDLPPGYVKHADEIPAGGGGGGGTATPDPPHEAQLDARDKGGMLDHWPETGIRPALGGWDL